MVQLLEDEDVEIADVAGDEEGENLPASILENLVADRPAIDDDVDGTGLFTLAHDIATRGDRTGIGRDHCCQCCAVIGREAGEMFQLGRQVISHMTSALRHYRPNQARSL